MNGSYADSNGLGFEYANGEGFSECGPVGEEGIAECQFGRFILSSGQDSIIYDLILSTVRYPSTAPDSKKITLPPLPSSSSISEWGLMLVLRQNWTFVLLNSGVRTILLLTSYSDLLPY